MKNPKHFSSKPSSSSSSNPRSRHNSSNQNPPNPPNPNYPHQSTKPTSSPSAAAAAASNMAGGPPISPPPYGFQDLERRTILLIDGTVRSYFALPRHYPIDPFSHPPDSKRKLPEDEFAWQRQQLLLYGNPGAGPAPAPGEDGPRASKQARGVDPADARGVDRKAVEKVFLRLVKTVNENSSKMNYLEDGKFAPLQCVVCGRDSMKFPDVHRLVLHAYNAPNVDSRVDHLGLHKALCALMGWDYTRAPDDSKAYQMLSVADASANREDLIVWPPTVIIHNTNFGRRKDGRMDGFGNKDMDMKLKELGFGGGKSKSMYGKEGHMGFTVVKFAETPAGLREAERLADYFEKDNHGRKGWARAEASKSSMDDEKNPNIVKINERNGERKRIFYGYMATASDLEKFDFDLTKRATIKSRKEFDLSD